MKNNAIICLLGILFLLSCESEDLLVSVGDNFIDSQTTISLIDSISVQMSTLKLDSIATSGTGYAMAGTYVDPEFGTVTSTSYFQIDMPITDIDDDEIFDSIIITIPYSGLSYGDTLQTQTFNIHRILEDVEPQDEETYLYNTTTFSYDDNLLGSKTLAPRPNFYDEIEIRLNDELGLELLEILRDDDDEYTSTSDFIDYFKGIAITPGDEQNILLSFIADTALHIELHTHLVSEERIENIYTFPYSSSLYQFNNITSEVGSLPLNQLSTQKYEISSTEMEDKAYLQAGIGLVTRIDFGGISKILEEERYNILYKAELVLKPVPGTFDEVALPQYLQLYYTDKNNSLVSQLTDDEGSASYASFYYDEFYNESNYYTFDVTDYIYAELSDGYVDPDNGLLVMLNDAQFQASTDRIVFDARTNSKYRPMLNLYYVFYE